ncbi:glucooligosaccharide oxidase-like protein [Rhexocercosporidium sp. MPI-PUGE-AT-0058]|nr:glucooligosaccharide oxidase-like protein [Rhexocercosporidium sp. MPI-PUGE-AT-0058]
MPRLATILTLLLTTQTIHAQTSPPPPSNTPTPLVTCLNSVSIPYSISSNSTWSTDISPWQLRIRPIPSAVIRPTTYSEIAAALSCARRTSTKVACRNGGHSYGSYGVGGNDGALVISLDAFQNISFDARTGLLTYGGGSIVGDVATWAWEKHGVHFPHVRANRVGLAGSSIGGGFGSTSRFLGTPMDNLESVKYMLLNGSIVTASRTQNSDLFFVAQGAGSSYGVLLSLTTRTWKPVFGQVTNFTISVGNVDVKTGVNALLAVQEYALSGACPDELSLRWSLTAPPYSGSGFFYGDPATFRSVIDPLMKTLPAGTNLTTAVADFWSMENMATPSISSKKDTFPPRNFYLQALVLRTDQPFTYESAYALYNSTTIAFNRTDMTKFGFIDLWGGVSRNVKDGDTCMAHANSLFLIRWEGRLAAGLTTFPNDGISYLRGQMRGFEKQLEREGIPLRGFVNYRDTELTVEEWSKRLYGQNWGRMRKIKGVYDPEGIFSANPQSVPV